MPIPSILPEEYKFVQLDAANTAANAFNADIISCRDALKVWFLISHYSGGGDTDLTLSLIESTDVTGSTTTAVTATFPVWTDTNAGTASDTMAKVATDAASYVINTGAGTDYLTIIEWDPAKFSAGFDCIKLADSGGNAGNVINVVAIMKMRYPQASLSSAIID